MLGIERNHVSRSHPYNQNEKLAVFVPIEQGASMRKALGKAGAGQQGRENIKTPATH